MIDGSVMEFVKWFISFVIVSFVVTIIALMFQLNEVNSFHQEVNYQIERFGGLTPDALLELNYYAISNYEGVLDNAYIRNYTDESGNQPYKDQPSSGFIVAEYIPETNQYYVRAAGEEASYGSRIHYIIERRIGNLLGSPVFTPSIKGSATSHIRGQQP